MNGITSFTHLRIVKGGPGLKGEALAREKTFLLLILRRQNIVASDDVMLTRSSLKKTNNEDIDSFIVMTMSEGQGLRYIWVRLRRIIFGFVSQSPVMFNCTAPARVSIHVPPGSGASAYPLSHWVGYTMMVLQHHPQYDRLSF